MLQEEGKDLETGNFTERWKTLDRYFNVAWALIVAVGVSVFSKDRLDQLWPISVSPEYLASVLGLVLLSTTVILVFRYVFAVGGEMQMLRVHLTEHVPPPPYQVFFFTIAFSILLGFLAYFSNKIIVFTILFVIYNLGDLWGQAMRDKALKEALSTAKTRQVDQTHHQVLIAIERYYMERPQVHRTTTIMFFSFVALVLSILSSEQRWGSIGPWLECMAYAVMVLNIVISEYVIFRWRCDRNNVLGERYSL
jgi:hypothetical protein